MSEADVIKIGLFLIGGLFSILWFLLKQKDSQQGEQITELFKKHEEDAKALTDLRLQIADAHYKKSDIDPKFDKLETALKDGFKSLGEKFEKLGSSLVEHIAKEDEALDRRRAQ